MPTIRKVSAHVAIVAEPVDQRADRGGQSGPYAPYDPYDPCSGLKSAQLATRQAAIGRAGIYGPYDPFDPHDFGGAAIAASLASRTRLVARMSLGALSSGGPAPSVLRLTRRCHCNSLTALCS